MFSKNFSLANLRRALLSTSLVSKIPHLRSPQSASGQNARAYLIQNRRISATPTLFFSSQQSPPPPSSASSTPANYSSNDSSSPSIENLDTRIQELLVQMARPAKNSKISACSKIADFAKDKSAIHFLLRHDILNALTTQLKMTNDDGIRSITVLALLHLSVHDEIKERAADSMVIEGLSSTLSSDDTATLVSALTALGNLATAGKSAQSEIRRAGALETMIQLLSTGEGPIREQAAYALMNTCSEDERNALEIRRLDGFQPLVEVVTEACEHLEDLPEEELFYVLATLSHCATSLESVVHLRMLDSLKYYVQLLSFPRTPIRLVAIDILISCINDYESMEMIKAMDVLTPMLSIIDSAKSEHKQLVSAVLHFLSIFCRDPENARDSKSRGIVDTLRGLLADTTESILDKSGRQAAQTILEIVDYNSKPLDL